MHKYQFDTATGFFYALPHAHIRAKSYSMQSGPSGRSKKFRGPIFVRGPSPYLFMPMISLHFCALAAPVIVSPSASPFLSPSILFCSIFTPLPELLLVSEVGSCRASDSWFSFTSPLRRNGDESGHGSSHSALRTLIQGMPMFALGVVMTLLSSYFTTEIGQALSNPSSTAIFTPTEMFVYSLLGLFSSLASMTFRTKHPSIASCFDDLTVVCFASTFASQICILTPVRHHRIVFSLCLIPLLPLDGSPCVLLFRSFNWILLRKTQHQFRSTACYGQCLDACLSYWFSEVAIYSKEPVV